MPFHIVTHCNLFDICFSLSFILSFHFPSPSSGFWAPTPPHSGGYKGSCYFKRSILYWIGETGGGGWTRSCDVTSTVEVQIFRHIQLHSTFIARSVSFLQSAHFRPSLLTLLSCTFSGINLNTRKCPKNCCFPPYHICYYIKFASIDMN